MKLAADHVQSLVVSSRHRAAEQAPEEILGALSAFPAPYRDGEGAGT
jgi:hypothetical protein